MSVVVQSQIHLNERIIIIIIIKKLSYIEIISFVFLFCYFPLFLFFIQFTSLLFSTNFQIEKGPIKRGGNFCIFLIILAQISDFISGMESVNIALNKWCKISELAVKTAKICIQLNPDFVRWVSQPRARYTLMEE